VRSAAPRATREDVQAVVAALAHLGARGHQQAVERRLVLAHLRQQGVGALGRDRVLRAAVAAAPEFGVAIGSSGEGYFLCDSAADVARCVADLRSRVAMLSARADALEVLVRRPAPVQQELWG
jgi:hypothetical protein